MMCICGEPIGVHDMRELMYGIAYSIRRYRCSRCGQRMTTYEIPMDAAEYHYVAKIIKNEEYLKQCGLDPMPFTRQKELIHDLVVQKNMEHRRQRDEERKKREELKNE